MLLGGFGFIGTNLVEELLKRGNYNLIIFESNNVSIQNPALIDEIKIYYGDFNNSQDIETIFQENQIDTVIHLISTTTPSDEDIVYDVVTNQINSIKLLEIMSRYSAKKIVFFSSGGAIYGNSENTSHQETDPTNPICSYAVVKLAIEKFILLYKINHDIDYLILRLSNPYGEYHHSPKQGFINVALRKILHDEKIIIWGDGSVVRDFIYIKDVVKIVSELLEREIVNETFNIGTGNGYSINEVLNLFNREIKPIDYEYTLPRKFDVPYGVLNIDKILLRINNFKFTSLEEGIKKTYNWLRQSSIIDRNVPDEN